MSIFRVLEWFSAIFTHFTPFSPHFTPFFHPISPVGEVEIFSLYSPHHFPHFCKINEMKISYRFQFMSILVIFHPTEVHIMSHRTRVTPRREKFYSLLSARLNFLHFCIRPHINISYRSLYIRGRTDKQTNKQTDRQTNAILLIYTRLGSKTRRSAYLSSLPIKFFAHFRLVYEFYYYGWVYSVF